MNLPRRPTTTGRRTIVACLTALCLTAAWPSLAFAQGSKNREIPPEEQKGYTLPYFFAGLAVLIVATTVCWPAGRSWEAKLDDEDE